MLQQVVKMHRLLLKRSLVPLAATGTAMAFYQSLPESQKSRLFHSAQCQPVYDAANTHPAAMVANKPKKVAVGYWTIRGLGAPLRMMVMYAGVPLEAINYDVKEGDPAKPFPWDVSAWFANEKPKVKQQNALANLPWVQVEGEPPVAQTNACFAYLGRKLGLWGDNDLQVVQCEQLLCEVMDLRNKMVRYAYQTNGGKEEAEKLIAESSGIFEKLEDFLVQHSDPSGVFFVGHHATAPDFHIWEMLDQYKFLARLFHLSDPLSGKSKLSHFYSAFAARPENQKYLHSALHKMPFNQKMAAFGSDPSGKKYVWGQKYSWGNTSGIY